MYWGWYPAPAEMLRQAPVDTLRQMFLGLHVMSYEQAIEDLKDLHE